MQSLNTDSKQSTEAINVKPTPGPPPSIQLSTKAPFDFIFFRAFKDREMLVNHMRCHIEEKPYECLQCGKKFFKPGQLKEHKRRHFESGNFACTHCGKKFFTSTKLQVSSSIISLLLILLYIVSYQIASFSSKWELPALLSPSFITRGREGAKALILMKHSQFDRTLQYAVRKECGGPLSCNDICESPALIEQNPGLISGGYK